MRSISGWFWSGVAMTVFATAATGRTNDAGLTPVPRVLYAPASSITQAPEFPALREYRGGPVPESTSIRMTTDGTTLFVMVRAHDAHPDQLVTRVSAASNYPAIWKEDSLELFFKPTPDYPEQYQFIVSCSGYFVRNHNLHKDNSSYQRLPWPDKDRSKVAVHRSASGYDVEIQVPLDSMAFKTALQPGQRMYGQVVRNYRGHGDPNRAVLQLFPAFVYIGTNLPPSNHHPKGFHAYDIVKPD